ncbi:MAG TPA: hypothetical protein VNE39_19040 [Planctomycetota bacterium]|nr:hypothetical protein [Planctomycetota bacterium]
MGARWLAAVFVVAAGAVWAEPLGNIKVVSDKAPDCSSLEALVASISRECKTDDEKAIAIYNACRYLYYHHAYPGEPGGLGALKMINVYGWGLCGGQHSVLAAVWEKAGFKWRYRGWPGHTTVECQYGGRWHYFDTFLKFYCWMPDANASGGRTVAGQQDIKANPALVSDAFVLDQGRKVWYMKDNRFEYLGDKANWTAPAFLVCGDSLPGVIAGCKANRDAGSPRGWASIQFDEARYNTAVNLGVGYALTLDWDKVEGAFYFNGKDKAPFHSCGDKNYRNCASIGPLLEPYAGKDRRQTWSNGTLVFKPDLRNDAFLASLQQADNVACEGGALKPKDAAKPASFVVEMACPYIVAKASGKLTGDDAKAEVSKDGKAWAAVEITDFAKSVMGSYRYLVRVTFTKPITALELTSIVQHNQEALPFLAPGRNTVTITAENPQALGKNRLVVTYAYCLGSRNCSYEQVFDKGAEVARAHYASWAETPIVVQKIVDKFPYTFEVPIPTPKGKYPVYPRMVLLRREVLAPGQEPMATPTPPSTPTVGANDVLATTPNPWLIGAAKPASRADVPTKATTFPLKRVSYVNLKGEVFAHNFIKWLKPNDPAGPAAWILLIGVDDVKLPEAKNLASAKLTFYVIEAHDKANMEAAAVLLKAPFEAGKPYDFKGLGDNVGSAIVKQGAGRDKVFDPPLRYEIDVTKAVRTWIGGEKPHGLALRIVPNRGVDDGWTVRFTPSKDKLPELEITTYKE